MLLTAGDGDGLGEGDGEGEGCDGFGDGEGDGLGDGDGDGLGDGEGDGDGDAGVPSPTWMSAPRYVGLRTTGTLSLSFLTILLAIAPPSPLASNGSV